MKEADQTQKHGNSIPYQSRLIEQTTIQDFPIQSSLIHNLNDSRSKNKDRPQLTIQDAGKRKKILCEEIRQQSVPDERRNRNSNK
uniref:Uncharacterized protein n=1 Tax=Rhizophora mucronata TaxID=61149 RepID=A0A2P2LS46_RHIMU